MLWGPPGAFHARSGEVKSPRPLSLMVGAVPFVGAVFTVGWWDRITPTVFGLPFNFAWLAGWIVLISLTIVVIRRIEEKR